MEENNESFEFMPGICPACGCPDVDEKIKKGPYYGKEAESHGYIYLWDCECQYCFAKWNAFEKRDVKLREIKILTDNWDNFVEERWASQTVDKHELKGYFWKQRKGELPTYTRPAKYDN